MGDERIACHGGIFFYDPNDVTSKGGVSACELVRERGEDVLEFLPVEVIPGTEEASTEDSSLGGHFREGLGDGRLSCSCQPVEPEYVSVLWIFGPSHDPIEDGFSSAAKAGVMMASLVSCIAYRFQLPKQLEVCGFLILVSVSNHPSGNLKPPHDDVLGILINPLCCFVDPICSLVDSLRVLVNALL